MSNPQQLVQKLWNYCNILRDDGLSYGDYVEQLTFLLFLKMADEQSRRPFNKPSPIPKGFSWSSLLKVEGVDLEVHYRHTLGELGKRSGIFTILKQHGRAAVVLPDNVLFEGGAGETIRRELLKQADVHTLLRLPTGIFYAQGVKANVLFFDRKPAQEKPWTRKLWIYDLRTNLHFTLKENTLKRSDLDDFVACYFGEVGWDALPRVPNEKAAQQRRPTSRHNRVETERFNSFTYEELTKRDKVNLDIFWLKDDALEESANLPAPEIIAADITADLEAAMEQFATIAEDLKR
ncbi:MAG TPA: N-6 DNA methylase [Candidatus Acidoferrum sp.]|nr:N-6 DNA methylase [Candidatus Acidoferrum sp.]